MRLRGVLAPVAILLFSSSALAQVDVFARRVEATKEGQTQVHGGQATVNLNSANGYEAGADVFWGDHLSTELSVARVRHEVDAAAFGERVDLGAARVTPFSAVVLFHTDARGALDFHAGAGASLVKFSQVSDTAELALLGVRSIRFHDDVAPVVSAGAAYRFGPRFALTADAKWIDIRTKTTATYADGTTEGAKLNLKQVSIGAGLSLRF